MHLGSYPTPAQVYLYVGGVWIDDAFRVEFRKVNEKVPLYGFDEVLWSGVALGHTLVTGNLILNYRYPGYLWTLVKESLHTDVTVQASPMVQLAHALIGATPEKRIEIIEQARQLNKLQEVQSVLRQITNSAQYRVQDEIEDPVGSVFRDSDGNHLPISIKIYFDKPDYSVYHREIVDIHFTGVSQAMSASASGGDSSASGRPIFEVYSFFAKDVRDKIKPGSNYRSIIEEENRYTPVSSTEFTSELLS